MIHFIIVDEKTLALTRKFLRVLALIVLIAFIAIVWNVLIAHLRQITIISFILSYEHINKIGFVVLAALIVTHNHPFFSRRK